MGSDRIEKKLVMVNLVKEIGSKRRIVLSFNDEDGNRYDYGFFGNMTDKEKNKFFQMVKQYEYIPTLDRIHNKPAVLVSFRASEAKYNPATGKFIYKMVGPIFKEAVTSEKEEKKPILYKKRFMT